MFFEPNNSCAVLNYVKIHFQCNTRDLVDPGYTRNFPVLTLPIPGDDGNNDLPGQDGPYNENDRKLIWWYHSDHLGSSTYLTDNFGRPSHYYETLPFGEMIVEHNQSTYNGGQYENAWKFNGKELDDATGMYYYGARYYDPRISIFVSVDPLAEKYPNYGGYIYTLNNPIMFIDPDGREVKGVNAESAKKLHEDMNTVFADEKFDAFRGLLTRGKKDEDGNYKSNKFDKISADAFKNATSGLSGNDIEAVTSVYNAINSKSEFVFEYITNTSNNLSESGNKVLMHIWQKLRTIKE